MSRAIAIDGPAASGKSTIAKLLSKQLNLVMVNSGAMYRAIAWKILELGIDAHNEEEVTKALEDIHLECGIDPSGRLSTVGFDGLILDEELRTEAVNNTVSPIAKIPAVRDLLLEKQRNYLKHSDVVMEGRDIGTVIFPETPYKFFFQASESVRQARREAEGITDSVAARDKQDSSRKNAPLKPAEDALLIDTGALDREGVLQAVLDGLTQRGW